MKQAGKVLLLASVLSVAAFAQVASNPISSFSQAVYSMLAEAAAWFIGAVVIWKALHSTFDPMRGLASLVTVIGCGYIALHPMNFVNWLKNMS